MHTDDNLKSTVCESAQTKAEKLLFNELSLALCSTKRNNYSHVLLLNTITALSMLKRKSPVQTMKSPLLSSNELLICNSSPQKSVQIWWKYSLLLQINYSNSTTLG